MESVLRDNLREEPVNFWWVWTKTGSLPTKFHESEHDAEQEAVRLALKHPGKKFIILHAARKISVAS